MVYGNKEMREFVGWGHRDYSNSPPALVAGLPIRYFSVALVAMGRVPPLTQLPGRYSDGYPYGWGSVRF